ncbi:MAG TPA: asparagine synthase-related protein, partial [Sphingomicrobium sp.]
MTAIAGVIGENVPELEHCCSEILQSLSCYGASSARLLTLTGAAFGCALHEQLPEDAFGRQPVLGGDRFLLVADVRLDNREELGPALGLDGARLASLSDADFLLECWMRWQEACLDRILGDFAFAVWDAREHRLTLVRDPTGQRPLFFAMSGTDVAFASMPAALLGWPRLRAAFNFERLATMLIGAIDLTSATYFSGISRVPPGHLVAIEAGRVSERCYWVPTTEPLRLSDSEFVEAYHEHLDRAVLSRLRRASGGVAVHLSSGYDSSAVAAAATRLSGESKPVAFTAAPRAGFSGPVPRNRIADESRLAAETAKFLGIEHVVVRPDSGILEPLRRHARLYQEPDRNVINMEWWTAIHSAARESGISTLLVAQLGNLTLHAGGLPTLAEWLRQGALLDWWAEARAARRSGRTRWRGILINSFDGFLGPRITGFIDQRFLGVPPDEQSYVRREWLERIRGRSRSSARDLLRGSPAERRLTLIRAQDIGVFRKGALGESGVDERDPTADRRVIEISLRLPPEQLLHRGEWRPLARRALAGRLPRSILDLNERGYQGADWFERISKAEAQALLEEIAGSSAATELLDLQRMRAAIDSWPSAGAADFRRQILYRTRLLAALSTGVFLQEFESSMAGA